MNRNEYPEAATLVGGFKCKLTQTERNSFNEYMREHELFHQLNELETEKKILVQQCVARVVGAADIKKKQRSLDEMETELMLKLYQVSKQWYADLMKKLEEEKKADANVE